MAKVSANKRGYSDGQEDAAEWLEAQGNAVTREELLPLAFPSQHGHLEWDEGAINAGAAELRGFKTAKDSKAYYQGYARGGREMVRAAIKRLAASRPRKSEFAAVASDGMRLVVWGIGSTEAKALRDARNQEGAKKMEFDVYPINASQADEVRAGDVSWPK